MDIGSHTPINETLEVLLKTEGLLDDVFFLLHCEKNADGTKNLILKGADMQLRLNRRIRNSDMVALTFFLKKYKEVVYIDLCYNEIGDSGLELLVDYYLCKPNNLKYLNLVSCDITENGIKYLCRVLSSSDLTVKELRLNGNKFGTVGGKVLAEFLNDNTYVEHLDIAETDQTLESLNYFTTILNAYHGHNKTIKVLNISRPIPKFNRCNYDTGYLTDILQTLLRCNMTLVELHLQKCQLDGHDIENLVIGLNENNTLLFLDLGLNLIGNLGMEVLGKYLKKRPNLLALNVSANGIKDLGARALSFGMPFSRLRLLDISNNRINDDGTSLYLITK